MSIVSVTGKNHSASIEFDSSVVKCVNLVKATALRFKLFSNLKPHTVLLANDKELGQLILENIVKLSRPRERWYEVNRTVEKLVDGILVNTENFRDVTMVFIGDTECLVVHRGLSWTVKLKPNQKFEFDVSSDEIINELIHAERQLVNNILGSCNNRL